MVEELVIHLGDCKTGTTSVQTTLARQLFTIGDGRSLIYPTRFNHIPLARRLEIGVDEATHMAKSLAKTFRESDATVGVISAEIFEFVKPANLAALFDGPFKPWRDRVRLISYIRPHAERFLSTFAERSKKGGFDGEMDVLAERLAHQTLLFYTPRVQDWQAAFGERYTVRPFVRSYLADGDVVRDFFSFALADTPVTFTKATDQNESLSLEDLVLMRHMHARFRALGGPFEDAEKAFGWNFSPILAGQPAARSTKLKLYESLARKLQNTYAEDAAALDSLAFEGTPMSDRLARAVDGAVAEPQSLAPEDHHSPEVLRLATANAEFLARIMAADPAHFRWATRSEEFRVPLAEQRMRWMPAVLNSGTPARPSLPLRALKAIRHRLHRGPFRG